MTNTPFQQKLEQFRLDIDAIDSELFQLILKRADIVKQVGELKDKYDQTHVKIRPAREARQLKNIYEKFADSPFPEASAIMIWRHLINGSLMVESPLRVQTLAQPQALPDYAREYFGCYAHLDYVENSEILLQRLNNDEIDIALFPMPALDSKDFWWLELALPENKLKVFLEFPYLPTACVRDGSRALAVSKIAQEAPNEHSHTLFMLEFSAAMSALTLKNNVTPILDGVSWHCSHRVGEDNMFAFLSVPYVLEKDDERLTRVAQTLTGDNSRSFIVGHVPNALGNHTQE